MNRGRVIARNASFLAIGQMITWSFSLVFFVIVPRLVGPSEWGEYSIAAAVTSLATTVASLGLALLLVKEISRDVTRAADYIGAALVAQCLLAIPYMLIVAGTMLAIGYGPHTRIIIALYALCGLVNFLAVPLIAGLQALEKMYFNSIGDVINKGVASLAAVMFAIFLSIGVIGILTMALAAAVFVIVLDVIWISRYTRLRPNFDWQLVQHLVVGGLPYWATGLFLTIYIWVDSVMLAAMTNTTVVGWYGAPTRLFGTLLFAPAILTTALFPALSHTFQHDRLHMLRLAQRSLKLLISLSLPIATGAALLSVPVVRLLLGPKYGPSGPILLVLALSLVPTYFNVLGSTILIAADRQTQWTRVMAAMCIINPVINIFAISYFQRTYGNGGLGASLALLATEILMTIAALLLMPQGLLNGDTLGQVARSAAATAIMAVVVRLFQTGYIGVWIYVGKVTFTLYTLVIPVTLGAVTYAAAALILRVYPREDLALVTNLAGGLARKLGLRSPLRSTAGDRAEGQAMGMLALFAEDLRVWKGMGWAGEATDVRISARDAVLMLWRHLGVRATLVYRLSCAAQRRHIPGLPTALQHFNIKHYGLDIVPGIPIGPGLYIPHPAGTVIMARGIGANCQLISAITLGMRGRREFPLIGDDVIIGAGARVLGGVHIGDGARVGANAVVLRDIPAGATAVGVPARVVMPTPMAIPAGDSVGQLAIAQEPALAGAIYFNAAYADTRGIDGESAAGAYRMNGFEH